MSGRLYLSGNSVLLRSQNAVGNILSSQITGGEGPALIGAAVGYIGFLLGKEDAQAVGTNRIEAFHVRSARNTLTLVKPTQLFRRLKAISATGFSTFFIDVAMGILTVLFNRQIMRYLGADALAVYGPIVNVSTFVQCCAYSVGQASQPILSVNYGAGQKGRIRETLQYALYTVALFSLFWTALSLVCPNLYIHIFMKPTNTILEIAPTIIRRYSLSFLLLPLNIFSTYYFQALMKPRAAFIVSVFRGCVVSGILILLLPAVAGADSIWFAMPITELIVAVYAVRTIARS